MSLACLLVGLGTRDFGIEHYGKTFIRGLWELRFRHWVLLFEKSPGVLRTYYYFRPLTPPLPSFLILDYKMFSPLLNDQDLISSELLRPKASPRSFPILESRETGYLNLGGHHADGHR